MTPAVLITGASSGIGKEMARILASEHKDLVITGRTESELQALAAELSPRTTVHVIIQDLSTADASEKIMKQVHALGLHVETLVNNAGLGEYGSFHEHDVEVIQQMMAVNMRSLTTLSHLVIPDMQLLGKGTMVNIASVAAYFPGPLMAVYYATKAYVLRFSLAIRNELKPLGIRVVTVCPGPTHSKFAERAHVLGTKGFRGRIPDSETVAKFAVRAMRRNRSVAIHTMKYRCLIFLGRLIPASLQVKIVRQMQSKS